MAARLAVDLDQSPNTITVNVTPVNDAPVISGPGTASVQEDAPIAARSVTGQLTGVDPDPGDSVQTWTVLNGTLPQAAQYSFLIDEFKVTRPGITIFDDTFGDGAPPPSAPNFSNGTPTSYVTGGSFTESTANGGQATLDSAHAVSITGVGTATPLIGQSATLLTDISSDTTQGLKQENDFTVEGTFDLIAPSDLREGYGIALTDRGPGVVGNDTLNLQVFRSAGGGTAVQLRDLDPTANTSTLIDSMVINATPQENQIVLRLSHAAGSNAISAAFDLYASGVYQSTVNFASTDDIFQGEDWTRAQFIANAPNPTVSYLQGIYGTLAIDGNGLWTYSLANNLPAVQALGPNDTVQDTFIVDASDGHGGIGQKTITISVQGVNDAPTITGDLAIAVTNGGSVALTTNDFQAVDPDNTPSQRTFSVSDATHGHVAFANAPATAITTFTEADLEAGLLIFVHDGSSTTEATFKVAVSDGLATTAPTTVVAFVPTVSIVVKTANGMDFQNDDINTEIATGVVQPGGTSAFTIVNAAANRDFVFQGSGFAYGSGNALIAGTIFSFQEFTHNPSTLLAEFTGRIDAAGFYSAAVAQTQIDQHQFDTFASNWTFNFVGGAGNDAFGGGDLNDAFKASGGSDLFDGQSGIDRANYTAASGPIAVQLATGTVVKFTDTTMTAIAGTDTLRSVEQVTGTRFADTFDATGFSALSQNAGSILSFNTDGTSNEFEGRDGNDIIRGNGNTRVSYLHATGPVTVDLAAGTADGDSSIGHDIFLGGVNKICGSEFGDTLRGSNNPANTAELFEGRGGDDFIDGQGGFDRAVYLNEDHLINVHLAAGDVFGGVNTGHDTLRSIEGIQGTQFDDTYDATGFTSTSVNGPNFASSRTFNEFEGAGGNDTITGNGNTRIAYYNATDGVTVILGASGSGSLNFQGEF